MDSEGRPLCGGDGCDGVKTAASSIWRKTRDSEQEIDPPGHGGGGETLQDGESDGSWSALVLTGPGPRWFWNK